MSHPERRHFFQLPWRSARRIQADIDEELRFELDMRTAELVQQGLADGDARRQALAEFGDLEQTRRYCAELDREGQRSERRAEWLAEVRQDVRFAWRGMRRTPAFAIVVLVTLALGLGANTAVFSVVRTVLLNQLPYHEPDRLVRIYGGRSGVPDARGMLSAAEISGMQQSPVFTAVAAFYYGSYTYVGDQRADFWGGMRVGGAFFQLLGVRPLLGRAIDMQDVGADAAPVVVLSYALWQRAFGGDSSIVGRTVRLSGRAYTVVGVMPPEFMSPERTPDIWTPLDVHALLRTPTAAWRNHMLRAIGRLADGVRPSQLHAALEALALQERTQHPELHDVAPANTVLLRDAMVGDVRPVLLIVMGAAALVLLLACVNVAGLFLSRATARRRELAVRAALGAGRARLVRQLLTESVMLALVGGAIGIGLAVWGKRILVDVAGRVLPPMGDVHIDASVLAFAVAVSFLSAVAFGLVPALAGTRFDLHGSLVESSRGASGGRASTRTSRVLVIAQVALAVVLLIGAGLLGRTLMTLEQTGMGFDAGPDVLTFAVNLSSATYPDGARQTAFFDAFTKRIRSLPGVRAVGTIDMSPWNGPGADFLAIGGRPEPPAGSEETAVPGAVSGNYFSALGIPIRRGRAFTSFDRAGAPPVAIVSESVARRYWPGTNPIGQHVRVGGRDAPWLEIVGVAGDVRRTPSAEPYPAVYMPLHQHPWGGAEFVVRTSDDAKGLVPAIRRILHDMDPTLPFGGARTMEDVLESKLSGQRLPMLFTTAFAALALVLAALGVYSVMAYSVTTRQREFGIRTALGARRTSVLALVVRQGMTMAVVGTAIGLLAAAAATRVLTGMLVGVTAHDPVTFVAMPLVLLGVSVAACLIPARRATKVEPVEALRAE